MNYNCPYCNKILKKLAESCYMCIFCDISILFINNNISFIAIRIKNNISNIIRVVYDYHSFFYIEFNDDNDNIFNDNIKKFNFKLNASCREDIHKTVKLIEKTTILK